MSAGWIVLICIVLFVAFLCWFPIRICIAREAKKKEQDAQKKPAAQNPKKKWTLKEILHLVGMILKSAGRLTRRFWKGFVIDKLTLHMAVAGSDAAETGIAYGKMNAQVYTIYSFAEQYVTLKNTDIQIIPDFLSTKSRMEVSCELFFRIGTLIASVFAALWCFIKLYFNDKKAVADAVELQEQQEKAAAAQ